MPPSRYYNRRARPTRRRFFRRAAKFMSRRMPRRIKSAIPVHRFARWSGLLGLTGNAAYNPYSTAQTFTLADIQAASEFTALFDQYRLDKIVLYFHLVRSPDAQSATTATYPKLYYIHDHDDSTPFATLGDAMQHTRAKMRILMPNKFVKIVIKPSVLQTVNAAASAVEPKYGSWISTANSNVPHYGLKWLLDDFTNTNYKLEWRWKTYMSLKDVR